MIGPELGATSTKRVVLFDDDNPLVLETGRRLAPVQVAYETYGAPNSDRSNTVFVCHALTGDAHAAGHQSDDSPRGWWDTMIGPGRPVDTDELYVVSPNLLGGCRGTTGPSSLDPATGKAFGLEFPLLSVRDLVTVHRRLLRHLGIERVHTVIGGSLGGMQGLQWALDHPDEVDRVAAICASARLSAMNIAFSAVGRAAIMGDPEFDNGHYPDGPGSPGIGLATARKLAHITYLSSESMRRKFDRSRRVPDAPMTFADDFEVEHYLTHQGETFLERFDALTYLYLSRAMDYFDPFGDPTLNLQPVAIAGCRFLTLSFDTDWRFGTEHSELIASTLAAAGLRVEAFEVASPWGHDSFLLEVPAYHESVRNFLSAP